MRLRYVGLLVFALAFMPFTTANMNCQTNLHLDNSGNAFQSVLLESPVEQGYLYPKGSEWSFTAPKRAENIVLKTDLNAELEVSETNIQKNAIVRINEDAQNDVNFNVSMTFPRAATVYDDQFFLRQNFLASCSGQSSLKVNLPPGTTLEEAEPEYNQEDQRIIFSPLRTSRVKIEASTTETSDLLNFKTNSFSVNKVPSTSENYIKEIMTEVEPYFGHINSYTGLERSDQQRLNLTYTAPNTDLAFTDASGEFRPPNKILLSSRLLSRDRIYLLETLVHEMAHSYSSRMLKGEDWWWEEGSVQYVTYKALEAEGHNTEVFKPSEEKVDETFEKCFSKDFITHWNPARGEERNCNGGLNYNELGYDHSYLIVKRLNSEEPDIIRKVYDLMKEKNVKFSRNQEGLGIRPKNNQINYFASQAAGYDMTDFFRSNGVETVSWKKPKTDLDSMQNMLEELESSTKYEIYQEEMETIDNLYQQLYEGRYETENVFDSEIINMENAVQNKLEKYNQTMNKYNGVKKQIDRFESEQDAELYMDSRDELNSSIEHIKSSEFQLARETIQEASSKANQTRSEIKSYQTELEDTRSRIESSNLLVSPFMFKAKDMINQAESSFSNGQIERARKNIEKAESYRGYSTIGAGVFYLLLIVIPVWIIRR